jgi:hypothetical protein
MILDLSICLWSCYILADIGLVYLFMIMSIVSAWNSMITPAVKWFVNGDIMITNKLPGMYFFLITVIFPIQNQYKSYLIKNCMRFFSFLCFLRIKRSYTWINTKWTYIILYTYFILSDDMKKTKTKTRKN